MEQISNYGTMANVFVIFAVSFSLAYLFCTYIFKSVGMFHLAKRWNLQSAVLAWIPVVNNIYLGYMADKLNAKDDKKSHNKMWLIVSTAVNLVFILLSIILLVIMALAKSTIVTVMLIVLHIIIGIIYLASYTAFLAFKFVSLYVVFKFSSHKYRVLYLVLAIIFRLEWLFLFITRTGSDVPYEQAEDTYSAPQQNSSVQYVSVEVNNVEPEPINSDEQTPPKDDKPNPFEEV